MQKEDWKEDEQQQNRFDKHHGDEIYNLLAPQGDNRNLCQQVIQTNGVGYYELYEQHDDEYCEDTVHE